MMRVPTRSRPPILWDEVALAAMTLLYLTTRHPMGFLIAVNGVLCHSGYALSLPIAPRLRQWDVGCNVVMSIYANLHTCGQPVCGALAAFSVLAWRLNQYTTEKWFKSLMHALYVQLVNLIALAYFVHACPGS